MRRMTPHAPDEARRCLMKPEAVVGMGSWLRAASHEGPNSQNNAGAVVKSNRL
jgi:hypothetical protein